MKSVLKCILSLVMLGCILAILGASIIIGNYFHSYQEGDKVYQEIEKIALHADMTEPNGKPLSTDSVIDFAALAQTNPDIVGWLFVPDTRINYPIVKREDDNEYYLSHLFDGTANKTGSIFLDARSEIGDAHCLIHGHNMVNGGMFRDLMLFKNRQFFQEHPYCLILTPEQNYVVEFFAGSVVRIDSPVWQLQFSDSSDRQQWLSHCWNAASVNRPVTLNSADKIVTLSTCTYEYPQARWIVQGRLLSAFCVHNEIFETLLSSLKTTLHE